MIHQIFLKFLREPLFHFLVLGAGLFMVYSVINGSVSAPADRIVVDETQALRLAGQFQRTWMRPPTEQELRGLVEEYVKEEILYREARILGLDQDDLVIRRRLRQKMEFINADLAESQAPTDTQLQVYFDANQDRFRRPDRFSLQQVYLNPHKLAGDVKRAAAGLLARLNTDPALAADPKSLGDATMLPAQLDGVTRREVTNIFGRGFAKDIEDMPMGRWSGPYESSYGLHLVRMTERGVGGLPALAEIRPILEREWRAERSKEANERFYEALRVRYDVEIRLPADSAGTTLVVR
ncbi:MAG: peptidyl-prolyl cis-trans isomerase [Deltaproteobacteria bacterium]|nr:MAG: peptidyl-prolyl cis-trans isomerase [Deltaproteobacteria bacterium]